jgi:hypothetical protein
MMPGIDVRRIPFPSLEADTGQSTTQTRLPEYDLVFTGFMTKYRANLIAGLAAGGFKTYWPERFVSHKRRDMLNRSTKLVVNIPQRQGWQWLSLMRVIAALRSGRATVSLGTADESKIAACTYQVDITRSDWMDRLNSYASNWVLLYQQAFDDYFRMAQSFEDSNPFPHEMLDYWAITDRLL